MRVQKWLKCLFAVYMVIMVKMIIFKYPYEQLFVIARTWHGNVILNGLETANFIPFTTIKMYIKYADRLNSFENLAGNILIFMPFGILFPLIRNREKAFIDTLVNALVLALGIEVFQLFSSFGAFDVDDIMLNCLGAVLGYLVYHIYRLYKKNPAMFPGIYKIKRVEDEDGAYFEEN